MVTPMGTAMPVETSPIEIASRQAWSMLAEHILAEGVGAEPEPAGAAGAVPGSCRRLPERDIGERPVELGEPLIGRERHDGVGRRDLAGPLALEIVVDLQRRAVPREAQGEAAERHRGRDNQDPPPERADHRQQQADDPHRHRDDRRRRDVRQRRIADLAEEGRGVALPGLDVDDPPRRRPARIASVRPACRCTPPRAWRSERPKCAQRPGAAPTSSPTADAPEQEAIRRGEQILQSGEGVVDHAPIRGAVGRPHDQRVAAGDHRREDREKADHAEPDHRRQRRGPAEHLPPRLGPEALGLGHGDAPRELHAGHGFELVVLAGHVWAVDSGVSRSPRGVGQPHRGCPPGAGPPG